MSKDRVQTIRLPMPRVGPTPARGGIRDILVARHRRDVPRSIWTTPC